MRRAGGYILHKMGKFWLVRFQLCVSFSRSKKESESSPADNSDQATADSWEKATGLEEMQWHKQCQKEGQSKSWVLNSLKHVLQFKLNVIGARLSNCRCVHVSKNRQTKKKRKGDSITDDATGGQQVKLRCHSCHSRTLKWYPWWTHLLLVKSLKERTEKARETHIRHFPICLLILKIYVMLSGNVWYKIKWFLNQDKAAWRAVNLVRKILGILGW